MKPEELRSRMRGVQVVLVTPMKENLEVDLDGLAANVHGLLEHAVDGFVVSGTYGEFPTLASDERIEMFRTVAAVAAGRVPVIACVAHSSTREVVSLAERAVEARHRRNPGRATVSLGGEPGPATMKAAHELRGRPGGPVRPPLHPARFPTARGASRRGGRDHRLHRYPRALTYPAAEESCNEARISHSQLSRGS